MDPPYHPDRYVVIQRKGDMIVASDGKKTVTRNASFMKPLPLESKDNDHMQPVHDENENKIEDPQFIDSENEPTEVVQTKTPDVLRRSSRNITQPKYLEDYVC